MGNKKEQRRRSAPKGRIAVSIADALFSLTQQKVLGLLFGDPARSFYASEIIALAGVGSGSVQRELERLEQSGLIVTKHLGNQKHYQANAAAPIFDELVRIAAKTFGLVDPIREALTRLKSKIDLALIYGSVAKGSATAGSDIDILIVGEHITLEEVFKALDPIETRMQRKVSPALFTREEFARKTREKDGFLARVLQGEVVPLIGDTDAAAIGQSGSDREAEGRARRRE